MRLIHIIENMAAPLNVIITEDHKRLTEDLEKQELESPGGIANGPLQLKLLAACLLQNDLCSAKYLWKRMPQSVKMANPELGLVWNVGQRLWQRDFPGLYAALGQEWSESVAQMMQALTEATRCRAILLVSRAYSSISIADFAGFVGLESAQAVQLAKQHGWQVDEAADVVYPSPLPTTAATSTPSSEQLTKLTDFVTFLEN